MHKLFTMQSDHPLFRYFTSEERAQIESRGALVNVAEGEFLIRAGESDSRLFAVEDGHLDVEARGNKTIATVGPGDVLGEISFIDESPRSVSVRAGEDAVVRAWDQAALLEELSKQPELLAKFSVAMSELLVERLRESVRTQGASRSL
jgi:CRP/FNR family cyclic AMP-dependent transcriptional regulator